MKVRLILMLDYVVQPHPTVEDATHFREYYRDIEMPFLPPVGLPVELGEGDAGGIQSEIEHISWSDSEGVAAWLEDIAMNWNESERDAVWMESLGFKPTCPDPIKPRRKPKHSG